MPSHQEPIDLGDGVVGQTVIGAVDASFSTRRWPTNHWLLCPDGALLQRSATVIRLSNEHAQVLNPLDARSSGAEPGEGSPE